MRIFWGVEHLTVSAVRRTIPGMDEWRRRARLSTRYLVFGSLFVAMRWGVIMSQYIGSSNAIGFGLAFVGVALLLIAFWELPGKR
jgi:hypothetical protein